MARNIQISSNRFTGSGLPLIIPRPLASGVVAGFDSRTPPAAGTADGADVPTWLPLVGSTGFAGSAAPTLERASTGAPLLRFARSGSDMLTMPMTRNTQHTVAILCRYTSIVTTTINPIDGSGSNVFAGAIANGNPRLFAGTALTMTSFVVDLNWHVWIIAIDGSNGILRVDNVETSGPIGNGAASGAEHRIGGFNNGGTEERSNLEVASWWRWNRILTASERAAEVANLKNAVRL